MSAAVIAFTARGAALARRIAARLGERTVYVPARLAGEGLEACGDLSAWTRRAFETRDALIFVSAAGIAVRAAAPFVRDKLTDPAVLCVDERGRFVIPLLGGHVGGANALARKIADFLGAAAVITTATDANGLFAVDTWAAERGLAIGERERIKAISGALLAGTPVGFWDEIPISGAVPEGLYRADHGALGFAVTARRGCDPFDGTLHLYPPCLALGIGCRRELPEDAVSRAAQAVLERFGCAPEAVCAVGTIDLKRDDRGIARLCADKCWPLRVYSAGELARARGVFTPSDFVRSVTGVDNVCERAAVLAVDGGELLIPKQCENGVTVAAARRTLTLSFDKGAGEC